MSSSIKINKSVKENDNEYLKVGRILEYQQINPEIEAFFHRKKDAGYDLYTLETKWIWPFKITKIPVNIRVALPDNTFGLVTIRSCMYDKGVSILNGIIDEPYRGIPHIAAHKIGFLPRKIKAGSRIGQMVILPYVECMPVPNDNIPVDTERGENKFGSTNSIAI